VSIGHECRREKRGFLRRVSKYKKTRGRTVWSRWCSWTCVEHRVQTEGRQLSPCSEGQMHTHLRPRVGLASAATLRCCRHKGNLLQIHEGRAIQMTMPSARARLAWREPGRAVGPEKQQRQQVCGRQHAMVTVTWLCRPAV
jgi:hypothetical protein